MRTFMRLVKDFLLVWALSADECRHFNTSLPWEKCGWSWNAEEETKDSPK